MERKAGPVDRLIEIDENEDPENLDNQEFLKGMWDNQISEKYLKDSSFTSKNRGWKTSEEISQKLSQVRAWDKFADAKKALEVKNKKTFGTKARLPISLHLLREDAIKAGGFAYHREIWSRKEIDGEECLMRTKVHRKTKKETVIRMVGIDESFDYLMKVHTELGHTGGCALWDYVQENKVSSFPKNVVLSFPMFCLHCRRQRQGRMVKKKKVRVISPRPKNEEETDVVVVSTIPCPFQKAFSGYNHIVFALYLKTEYVLCHILDNISNDAVINAISTQFIHTGFPKKIHVTDGETLKAAEVSNNVLRSFKIFIFNCLDNNHPFSVCWGYYESLQHRSFH